MSALFTEGQALLAPICRAVDALHEGDAVDVEGLLWAWRRLAPRCHPGAASDVVDVASLVEVLRRRALGDPILAVDDDPRGSPRRQQLARALADACVLALERQKLKHGMTASSSSLQACFASPEDARATLQALADSEPVVVDAGVFEPPEAPVPLLAAISGKELHVVAGGGARRLHDVLSPYVRRLRVELALLGRNGAVVDDDDVYRGLELLNAREPRCVAERRAAEPFDDAGFFAIDTARVPEEGVDRRARALIGPLKKANITVVGVVDVLLLPCLLALRPASVQVLASSTAGPARPRALLEGARGAVWPTAVSSGGHDGDGSCSISVPWLGLLPVNVDGDEDAFWGCNLVARARVDDEHVPAPVVGLVSDSQRSAGALEALAAIVPVRR
ncbi:MAG: hypothetical protein Q8O67_09330 [Deltaproteobacteria bacterium]|nr:hypothetical protein [Deltaproteobacteria bacterium]